MSRKIELIMVTEKNNNKFYRMEENSDGTFTSYWGRVGSKENVTTYPIDKWDKQYNSKIKKGYKDISHLKTETNSTKFVDIMEKKVKKLFKDLMDYSNRSVVENYTVSSESVTQVQIDEAQEVIDYLAGLLKTKKVKEDFETINKELIKLYSIIPRKMKKVQYHLLEDDFEKCDLKKIVVNEQDTLDVMAQQVSMNQAKSNNTDKPISILDALGITVENANDEEIAKVKELMGSDSNRLKNVFKVINTESEKKFKAQRNKSFKHWTRLLWHGSRNENWLNILKTSLLIRPAGSILTGAMFGNGIYFANKFKKSLGYSSLSGSYWTGGNSKKGYLALYEVNTGYELREQSHTSWMYDLNFKKLQSKGDYDSLYAQGGIDLRNDEFIVYKESQCTIRFLVEVE